MKWRHRILGTTRGKVVELLRRGPLTVSELARKLRLTDNAIRAHLTALERDGLVEQVGTRTGFRKPNAVYGLTADADQLFPKAYAGLLGDLLTVLEPRLGPHELEHVLREVGRRAAAAYAGRIRPGMTLDERLQTVVEILAELGGMAHVRQEGGQVYVRGDGCPLGRLVPGHPEACKLAESLISELLGVPVHEQCDKGAKPSCRFAVEPKADRRSGQD